MNIVKSQIFNNQRTVQSQISRVHGQMFDSKPAKCRITSRLLEHGRIKSGARNYIGWGPVDMWALYKVSGMSRDNVIRTRYFHYVYDLSTCLHVKIATARG